MSDDDLDLLEGDLWGAQGQNATKAPQKHGLIINVGPHKQWPYSDNTSGPVLPDSGSGFGNGLIMADQNSETVCSSNNTNQYYLASSDDAMRVIYFAMF